MLFHWYQVNMTVAAVERTLLTKALRDLAGVDRRVNLPEGFATKYVCMLTVVIIAKADSVNVSQIVSRCQGDAQGVVSGKLQDKDPGVTPTKHSVHDYACMPSWPARVLSIHGFK